jgi:hypothetical protein
MKNDTIVSEYFERVNGEVIMVREVVTDSSQLHDWTRIVAMTLLCVGILVILFYKKSPDNDQRPN